MSKLTSGMQFQDHLERIMGVIPGDFQVYLVGGAVRDILLNRNVHDLDFVILEGDVLEISRQVADKLNAAYYPLDPVRRTARVITKSEEGTQVLDFAAPRGIGLESDLTGRDFTINAMAIDLSDPLVLVDPLHGARDLHEKILRTCSSILGFLSSSPNR